MNFRKTNWDQNALKRLLDIQMIKVYFNESGHAPRQMSFGQHLSKNLYPLVASCSKTSPEKPILLP